MHVCKCARRYACLYVHTSSPEVGTRCLLLSFCTLEPGSLTEAGDHILARLAGQWDGQGPPYLGLPVFASQSYICLTDVSCWGWLSCGCGDLNSDPYACTRGTLPTASFLPPQVVIFLKQSFSVKSRSWHPYSSNFLNRCHPGLFFYS